MGKRKRKPAAPQETESPSGQKRARQSSDGHGNGAPVFSQSISYGRVDPTYGQRSAFPGLDGDDEYDGGEGGEGGGGGESDVECSVDAEALRYLRSVREEASGIPTLLVAPRGGATHNGREGGDEDGDGGSEDVDREIYENGVGDSRGWYEDGAYTAAPTSPLSSSDAASDGEHGGGRNAQEVYYKALLGRFEALRQQLAQVPPRHAVERLGADHGCYLSVSTKDQKMWRWRLLNTEPKPAQLARMGKDTVLRLLRMLGDRKGGYLGVDTLAGDEGGEARRRASAWIWGLLARLPARGELISEEVGVVRELGKRAVWVSVEMKGTDMRGLGDQMGEGEDEEDLGDEEVVDFEVDGDDEELDPELDGAELTNGLDMHNRDQQHDTFSQHSRNSSPSPGPPIIGPISPESLRGQSSPNLKSTSKTGISETPTSEAHANEDEALATARARLLARLESPSEDPQPVITDDEPPIETLLKESEQAPSLPQPGAHEARSSAPATQKQQQQQQPHRLAAATRQHPDRPLRQPPEPKAHNHHQPHQQQHQQQQRPASDGDACARSAEAGPSAEKARGQREERQDGTEHGQGHGHGTAAGAAAGADDGHGHGHAPPPAAAADTDHAAKALVDMILTVAGEVYGQRDLLQFREVW